MSSAFTAAFRNLILPFLSSLQIGSLLTWGLQGVLCVQVYNYYLSFPRDPIYMKLLVYISLILEIAQTILVTHDAFKIFAIGFGDFTGLDKIQLLWLTLPILGGIAGLLCHLTFAYRITLLSGSKAIGIVIASLSSCAAISAFVFGAKLFRAGMLSQVVVTKHIYLTCGIWNGSGALCDVVIAACMFYYLSMNQTGFKNTDVLITRIVRLSIETGIATATASIASAVLFIGFREKITISVYFVIPAIMITKLYAITILATFNNRPLAVGGPPPLPDIENCYDETLNARKYSRNMDNLKGEIRIGRTVVKQVWNDVVPLSHLNEVYGEDSHSQTLKDDDGQSSVRKGSDIMTPIEEAQDASQRN